MRQCVSIQQQHKRVLITRQECVFVSAVLCGFVVTLRGEMVISILSNPQLRHRFLHTWPYTLKILPILYAQPTAASNAQLYFDFRTKASIVCCNTHTERTQPAFRLLLSAAPSSKILSFGFLIGSCKSHHIWEAPSVLTSSIAAISALISHSLSAGYSKTSPSVHNRH